MSKTNVDIINGRITFGKKGVNKLISNAEDGKYVLRLEEWKQSRRIRQNAFIHVCFDVYGKEMGYSPAEAKFLLKKEYGINELFKNKRTEKQELRVRKTSDYTIEECAVFIDRLLRHFEFDCNIIIDPELRKQYKIDELTGELKELAT